MQDRIEPSGRENVVTAFPRPLRDVRVRADTLYLRKTWAVIAIAIVLIVASFWGYHVYQVYAFRRDCVPRPGVLIGKSISKGRGITRSAKYWIQTSNGRIENSEEVGERTFDRLPNAGPITVLYSPSTGNIRVEPVTARDVQNGILVFGGSILWAAVMIFGFYEFSCMQARQVLGQLRNWEGAKASLLRIKVSGTKTAYVHGQIAFRDADGHTCETSIALPREIEVPSTLPILYNPETPTEAVLLTALPLDDFEFGDGTPLKQALKAAFGKSQPLNHPSDEDWG